MYCHQQLDFDREVGQKYTYSTICVSFIFYTSKNSNIKKNRLVVKYRCPDPELYTYLTKRYATKRF